MYIPTHTHIYIHTYIPVSLALIIMPSPAKMHMDNHIRSIFTSFRRHCVILKPQFTLDQPLSAFQLASACVWEFLDAYYLDIIVVLCVCIYVCVYECIMENGAYVCVSLYMHHL